MLKLDKEIVAFPILSATGIGIITVPFALLFFAVIQESDNNVVFYLTVFICLVLTNSVAVFLRRALVACAITRLRGGILMSGAGCAISMI